MMIRCIMLQYQSTMYQSNELASSAGFLPNLPELTFSGTRNAASGLPFRNPSLMNLDSFYMLSYVCLLELKTCSTGFRSAMITIPDPPNTRAVSLSASVLSKSTTMHLPFPDFCILAVHLSLVDRKSVV